MKKENGYMILQKLFWNADLLLEIFIKLFIGREYSEN